MYEGGDEEDYGKFKEDMEKAFVHNRISKSDKVAKLRECLRGHAKRLIPESITNDLEKAWEALDKAFGKPARLMRFRKAALDKLGTLPKENAKSGVKGHVEWYLELEGLLQSLIDLGRKSDEMYMEAFSPTMLDKICSMFPRNIGCKLSRCDGQGENKLVKMLQKISELRSDAQDWQLIRDANPTAGATGGDSGASRADGGGSRGDGNRGDYGGARGDGSNGRGYSGNGGYGGKSWYKNGIKQQAMHVFEMPSLVVYNPPRRDEKC